MWRSVLWIVDRDCEKKKTFKRTQIYQKEAHAYKLVGDISKRSAKIPGSLTSVVIFGWQVNVNKN